MKNDDKQDDRDRKVRQIVGKCYALEDDARCFEFAEEITRFANALVKKHSASVCNNVILYHALAMSTIAPDAKRDEMILDFDGVDSIYQFALILEQRI